MRTKSIALILAFTMGIPMVGYAQEKISYEQALTRAIQNNLKIEREKDRVDEIQDILEEGIPNRDDSWQGRVGQSIDYQSALDKEKIAKLSYETQKEAMEIALKNIFYQIEYLEKNDEVIKEKIYTMRNKLSMDTIKYKLGMISKLDFENNQIELDKLHNMQKENTLQWEMAYKDLGHLVNSEKVSAIQYLEVKYVPLATLKVSKEASIGNAISNSISIGSQNAYIRELSERIKYDLLDKSQTALPRDESKTSLQLQDVELRLNKQAIADTVLEAANTIEKMEVSVKGMKEEIQNLESRRKQMEKLVSLGMEIQQNLDELDVQIKELKLTMENTMAEHQVLLERYLKPYLLTFR